MWGNTIAINVVLKKNSYSKKKLKKKTCGETL